MRTYIHRLHSNYTAIFVIINVVLIVVIMSNSNKTINNVIVM